ncbi:MAG: DUF6365 family protein [Xanthobacteraceae bacterium]
MKNLLFVVTTSANMGDLALCRDWITDIGRDDFRYGYVLSEQLDRFIDARDARFYFAPEVDVKNTILAATERMQADGIVFASNAFWNLPGQRGAEFGRFPIGPGEIDIPIMSFDPFEVDFEIQVPNETGVKKFESVPKWVWALQYMSRQTTGRNDCHYCAKRNLANPPEYSRRFASARWGWDTDTKTILFPISPNRYYYIRKHYPDYYSHLADQFSRRPWIQSRLVVISPEPVPQFRELSNVVGLSLVDYDEFLALTSAADLYLTDSLISCIVDAFHLGTPSLLLTNSEKSRALSRGTFLENRFFPYRVFPYGMWDICEVLKERFEIAGCFAEAEIFDGAGIASKTEALLFDHEARAAITDCSRQWRQNRLALPSARETIDFILSQGAIA